MGLDRLFNEQTESQKSQESLLTRLGAENGTTPVDMMRQMENVRSENERISSASAELTKKGILPQLHVPSEKEDPGHAHDIASGGISHRISESLSMARAETNPSLVRHR